MLELPIGRSLRPLEMTGRALNPSFAGLTFLVPTSGLKFYRPSQPKTAFCMKTARRRLWLRKPAHRQRPKGSLRPMGYLVFPTIFGIGKQCGRKRRQRTWQLLRVLTPRLTLSLMILVKLELRNPAKVRHQTLFPANDALGFVAQSSPSVLLSLSKTRVKDTCS